MRWHGSLCDRRLRFIRRFSVLAFAGCLAVLLSCGEDKSLQPPQNAAYGSAGNVLVADTDGHQLWVGFNSPSEWNDFLERHHDGAPTIMIGGEVVVDPSQALGFHFDPGTTMARGSTDALNSLWIQATLDEVRADPAHYSSLYGVLVPVTIQRYVSDKMW